MQGEAGVWRSSALAGEGVAGIGLAGATASVPGASRGQSGFQRSDAGFERLDPREQGIVVSCSRLK